MNRYLTPAEKTLALESWLRDGEIDDPGAREQCNRLNRIEGVCTVQSCIGHVKQTSAVARDVQSGCIEMRLDETRTILFYSAMPTLKAITGVEDAVIHFRADEQRCTVWFEPGLMTTVVDALVRGLSPAAVGILEPNPNGGQEARC
jgi:hypothetical protein